ncbi:DUF3883 domain-containing protein [bacterium]|nr:DUF3883 domain-containing protein [bacterium]
MLTNSLPIGRPIHLHGHFDVPVTLEDARPLGAGYELLVRTPDGILDEVIVTADEIALILQTDQTDDSSVITAPSGTIQLLVESNRIRLAYAHDRQFAVSLSGIRTLPHQIEAVYQHMLPQPRLRFLLADDPGAGKTIQAGLLLKEMKLRQAVERVLILCPAPLCIQWQDEMLRWFSEPFDTIDSSVDKQQLINPWQRHSQVIASIDYAKQDEVRERIWQQRWDLLIIDEAHKCSARSAPGGIGRESRVTTTKRYELALKLTAQADHVLLLTATPHHGDDDQFGHFLRLIDPDLFPEPHRLKKQSTDIRKEIFRLGTECPWSLRRLKEDLRDMRGHRLFPDRHARTATFCLNAEEFALYKSVTRYINEYMPQQPGTRRSSAALARTVLQRRLASSTYAIHESLKRRLLKQEALLKELEELTPEQRQKRLGKLSGRQPDIEMDEDDLDDEARDQVIDDYIGVAELDQIREEIFELQRLVDQARNVRDRAIDSKLNELKKCLGEAEFADLKDGRGKLLLFTEHRDTLNYIRGHLEQWGYTTCEIHGGMNPHQRKFAQEQFRTQSQVCVATEAAGEGINLQFCHLMINYDMPWNPTRLEQRLGRIHRIGQERDVYAFNFVATESELGDPIIEGRILSRLLEKLEQMNDALGGRVFDVIGEVLSLNDVNLPEILREAAYDPRRLDEYIDQIDRIDPHRLKEYEESTGIALARSFVDFKDFQHKSLEVEERRLMPRYVESHFLKAAKEVGLRVEQRADGLFRIEHVLQDLRSERLRSVAKVGKADTQYKKVTFQKEVLEQDAHLDAVLVGPGHPLYAAVDEKLTEKLAPSVGMSGFFVDPFAATPYQLHFFEIAIKGKDIKGQDTILHGELVAVKEQADNFEIVPCDSLLDLLPHEHIPEAWQASSTQGASDFLKSGYQLECRARVQSEREKIVGVVREYLANSFKARIRRAQERYYDLLPQSRENPDYKLAADEALKRVGELERSRDERMSGLDRLAVARTGPVRHVATAVVLTADSDVDEQLSALADELDPDIRRKSELAAEDVVIAALIAEGFPEDRIQRVGHLKLGFDIRAHRIKDAETGEVDVRRIEVKGRVKGQPVRLTTNEWYKAQQLGDTYWLSVVWNPTSAKPEHVAIKNPGVVLDHAKREIMAARFYEISADAIRTAI